MLSYAEKRYTKEEVLSLLHPLVAEWFSRRFERLTPPQEYAVPLIYAGKNVLVCSPTGTGKTLTAFLTILSELFSMAERGELKDSVYCIYISPLRALSNDIYRNLEVPLKEIRKIAEEKGKNIAEVRHAVRTGDTPSSERQKMLRKPPHIIITTPESLAIMLTTIKFKEKLRTVRWVIVDEVHSLCENKRGAHLSLSLERLRELVGRDFVRIGLSATINPLDEVALFLVGYDDTGEPRDCVIIDTSFVKKKEIKVLAPVPDLIHTPSEIVSQRMYGLLADIVNRYRTTLIFTNTRSGTERVVFHLKQLLEESIEGLENDFVAAHHGSLSRNVRLDVEEKLKRGELKAVVSSTSLELGIDIGYIDVVVQLGSPKSVTRCLQRIGRSGHRLHEVSRGLIICMDRDDLVECAVMVREAYRGHLDRARIPRNALDVLAQHILGMAIERKWQAKDAYKLIKRSYCYHDLSWEDFESVLKFLSGSFSRLRQHKVYGKIWYDPEDKMFGRRGKYARIIYYLNIGTIPDEVAVKVFTLNGKYVGNIEEEFLERLMRGDRFVLGGKVYEFVKTKGLKAYVKPVYDAKPTVPSWFSEMLPLSYDLAVKIGGFRRMMFKWLEEGKPKEKIIRYLKRTCRADDYSAEAIYQYFAEEYQYLRILGLNEYPSDKTILVEKFLDNEGRIYLIFHALFGRRVNDALSRAYAYVASRKTGRNIGIAITDHGFALIFPRGVKPAVKISDVRSDTIEDILKAAVVNTELMKRRFRHVAVRSLMILRNYKGHEISVNRQQLSAKTLLNICRELSGFPVLKETFREILEDVMDIEHAKEVLRRIETGRIKVVELPVQDTPSPFSHGIILVGLSDVVLMEDRRRILERLHKLVMEKIKMSVGESNLYNPALQTP